eukprot:TRINITY_DN3560_c0_g1_i4.p1 TRINITY_DN3560_c0_g1~~TRINITY_DN3560_c0_g1_i4.p1  ORF type:complete len:461 (+),score=57.92 TRINITY_DN3560_c0_g1_i4:61-1383(+)
MPPDGAATKKRASRASERKAMPPDGAATKKRASRVSERKAKSKDTAAKRRTTTQVTDGQATAQDGAVTKRRASRMTERAATPQDGKVTKRRASRMTERAATPQDGKVTKRRASRMTERAASRKNGKALRKTTSQVTERKESYEADAKAWLEDEDAIRRWAKEHDLNRLVKESGGFVRIRNVLPDVVAEWALDAFLRLPAKAWERTSAPHRDDGGYADSIPHHFDLFELESHEAMLSIARLLWRLLPQTVPNFTAARYGTTDHIAPHDDLVLERYSSREVHNLAKIYDRDRSWNGGALHSASWRGTKTFERQYAAVYYLNKDWPANSGGLLVDLETGQKYAPEFNTLVVFSVPRMHKVTAIESANLQRYSIFGWWLEPEERPQMGDRISMTKSRRRLASALVKRRPAVAKKRRSSRDVSTSRKRPAAEGRVRERRKLRRTR